MSEMYAYVPAEQPAAPVKEPKKRSEGVRIGLYAAVCGGFLVLTILARLTITLTNNSMGYAWTTVLGGLGIPLSDAAYVIGAALFSRFVVFRSNRHWAIAVPAVLGVHAVVTLVTDPLMKIIAVGDMTGAMQTIVIILLFVLCAALDAAVSYVFQRLVLYRNSMDTGCFAANEPRQDTLAVSKRGEGARIGLHAAFAMGAAVLGLIVGRLMSSAAVSVASEGYYGFDAQLYYLMLGLASVLTVGIGVCGDFLNRLVNFRSGGCWLCELAAMLGAGSLIGVFSAQGQAIMGYAISELCYEFGWYGLSQDIMYYTWSIFAEAVGQALLYLYYRYVLFACTLDANKASGTTAPEAAPVTEAAPEAPQVVVVRE